MRNRSLYFLFIAAVLCALNMLLLTVNNNKSTGDRICVGLGIVNNTIPNSRVNIVIGLVFDADLSRLHSIANSWAQKSELHEHSSMFKIHFVLFLPDRLYNLHEHPEFFTSSLASNPDVTVVEQPSLLRPHARFPEMIRTISSRHSTSDWFVFLRAETYIYLNNLVKMLDSLNPSDPICLGHMLLGDDQVPQVVSSDAGFVLSRKAVHMSSNSRFCHANPTMLETTLATEIALSRCFSDVGVQVLHVAGFRPLNPLDTILANIRNNLVEYHPNSPAITRRLLHIEPRNRTNILPITYFNVSKQIAQVIYDEERPVPKIIHQIWMGDIAKAPLENMFGCKDLSTQNGWTYKLWDDETISKELLPRMINYRVFSEFPNLHGKSDILRYEILYHWGGVYVDADTVCFRPFDRLLSQTRMEKKEAFLAYENENKRGTLLGSSILGAIQYSNAMLGCIWELNFRKLSDPAFIAVGPHLLTDAYQKYGMSAKILPSKTFFPFHMTEFSSLESQKWRLDDPNVFAFHRFATTVGGYKPTGATPHLYFEYLKNKDPIKAAIGYTSIKKQFTLPDNSSTICIDVVL